MAADLRGGTLTPLEWQDGIGALFDRVPLSDLLAAIDFERVATGFPTPDKGVRTKGVTLPRLDGPADAPTFIGKIFGMKRDRAIIPNGHRNMVSCYVVLEGELHLRQYDRIADEGGSMVLEPTIDEVVGPATHSSISDERDNVHWLVARTEVAFTFDVIVLDLGGRRYQVENLDPERGERLSGGLWRVPKLGVTEALEKYGHVPDHERLGLPG